MLILHRLGLTVLLSCCSESAIAATAPPAMSGKITVEAAVVMKAETPSIGRMFAIVAPALAGRVEAVPASAVADPVDSP